MLDCSNCSFFFCEIFTRDGSSGLPTTTAAVAALVTALFHGDKHRAGETQCFFLPQVKLVVEAITHHFEMCVFCASLSAETRSCAHFPQSVIDKSGPEKRAEPTIMIS